MRSIKVAAVVAAAQCAAGFAMAQTTTSKTDSGHHYQGGPKTEVPHARDEEADNRHGDKIKSSARIPRWPENRSAAQDGKVTPSYRRALYPEGLVPIRAGMNLDGDVREIWHAVEPRLVEGRVARMIRYHRGHNGDVARTDAPEMQITDAIPVHFQSFPNA